MSAEVGAQLPWDSLTRLRAALVAAHPHLGAIDTVPVNTGATLALGEPGQATFRNAVRDYYLTNPITRASSVMGELQGLSAARTGLPLAAE